MTWDTRWILMPFALIGLSLVMSSITVVLAVTNRSMIAEPGYYDDAIRWDEHRMQMAANDRLRWRVTSGLVDGRLVSVVQDKHGVPISGAFVECELVPAGVRSARRSLSLREAAPGRYEAAWPSGPTGRWDIECRVELGEVVYTDSCRRFIKVKGGDERD